MKPFKKLPTTASAAAAFRRLCVETTVTPRMNSFAMMAAAFRRLCVETNYTLETQKFLIAAAFRRLCVETSQGTPLKEITKAAAFRRLCVETRHIIERVWIQPWQPPSGGCVLKQTNPPPINSG